MYARRREAVQPLIARGAVACESPKDVAAESDVIFTMVTDTKAAADVMLGDHGIIHGARTGSVVVDHSTISPSGSRSISAALKVRGIQMLDAPVSGGIAGAHAGTLSIMIGGDEAIVERCRPLLSVLGTTIVRMGPSGAGQVAKACNQICIVVNQLGVAEAMLVAEKNGLDLDALTRVLLGGFASSRILELQGPKMASRQFVGDIPSRLHYKDALIALETAREIGVTLPATVLAAEILGRLQETGGAELDSAAVLKIIEELKSGIPDS